MNISMRPQKVSDAQHFYEILSNPNFTYFTANPQSVEEEIAFLKQNATKRRNKSAYNFSVILDSKLVGGMGIIINNTHTYIGEAGYFIDEQYWGKGIAAEALRLLEQFAINKTDVRRVEIRIALDNIASQKVALKCGYQKEGTLTQAVYIKDDWFDCYLYARIIR